MVSEAESESRRSGRVRRLAASALLVLVILAGLGVHALLPDTDATDIAGDALYACAVYLFLVALAPRWSPFGVGTVAATWCIVIELFQLTGIPLALGAQFAPAMLVLGTVFDVRDLAVYLIAIVGVMTVDFVQLRIRRH